MLHWPVVEVWLKAVLRRCGSERISALRLWLWIKHRVFDLVKDKSRKRHIVKDKHIGLDDKQTIPYNNLYLT